MSSENRYTNYDPWAWLYNKSEAHLALNELLPVLEKLLLQHLPQQAQIFDLCCGTGQLAQQLILKGYQVTGLDGSEKMLHYARENAPNGTFILSDARCFKLSSSFDAAICVDSSLNHIMSLEELKSVFRNVYAVLETNGLFLFDLGLEKRYSNIPVNDGELEEDYAWTVGETYNPDNQTGTFTITIFQLIDKNSGRRSAKSGSVAQQFKRIIYNNVLRHAKPSTLLQLIDKEWQSSAITFSVKPYSQLEVTSALEEVGFTQVKVYDYQGKISAPTNQQSAYFVSCKL